MVERRRRLNQKFKWTSENIKRVVKVSDKMLAAWEKAFLKAKNLIAMMYAKEENKKSFWSNYNITISISPEIWAKEKKSGEWDFNDGVYHVLSKYLSYPNNELEMNIGKDGEKHFRKDIHIDRKLSWNIEGFGDIELKDEYICYAIHILYSHKEWTNEDILKINNIRANVEIKYDPYRYMDRRQFIK
jgi:hypothetical protein